MNDTKMEKLAKNTIIIFISKFCTQFLSFFILPFITAFLTTDEYGTYDLISTYSWLLAPFLSIQLENGIFRFLIDNRNNEEKTCKVISSGIVTSSISIIIVTIMLFTFNIMFHINNFLLIYLLSLSTLLLNIPLQISRGLGDNLTYAKGSIVTGIVNVFMCFLTVYVFKLSLDGMLISNISSNIIGGIYVLIKEDFFKLFDLKKIDKKEMCLLIRYSLPLVPNSISSWITSISDKVMISIFIGVSANGIYSIATKFSILLSHLYSVFNLSWTESASVNNNYKEKESFFSDSINGIFKICTCICLLVISLMPIIFRIMINHQYAAAYNYIPFLILGSIFEILSGLLGAVYISFKFSKKMAISTLIAGTINILINMIMMKKYGIIVACFSTILSYVILTIYRIVDLRKYIKIKYDIKYFICLLIMYLLNLYLYFKNSIFISFFNTVILLILVVYLNRNIINKFVKKR